MGYYWLDFVHSHVVLSLRIVHSLMAEQHIKTYLLDNSRRVTVKQVAEKVGISESAARNRLIKSKNPDRIYAPAASNGGCLKKKHQYKQVNRRPIEDPMFVLALKAIGGKPS